MLRIPLLDRLTLRGGSESAVWRIREAGRTDGRAVAALWREMMTFHAALDPRFQFTTNADREFEDHFRNTLRSRDARILVAEANDEVVGYILAELHARRPLYPAGQYGFISDLSVRADWRRQGVGRALVAGLVKWFRSRGVSTIELFAADRSPDSQAFWQSMGFTDFLHLMRMEIEENP